MRDTKNYLTPCLMEIKKYQTCKNTPIISLEFDTNSEIFKHQIGFFST